MRIALLALLLLCSTGCGDSNQVELISPDAKVKVTVEPFAFTVLNAQGDVLLDSRTGTDGAYGRSAPTLDRPTYTSQLLPGWDTYEAHDGTWVSGSGKARLVEKTSTSVTVAWDIDGATMRVTLALEGARVRIETGADALDGGPRYNKSTLAFGLTPDEHFFGLGERFGTFDHRGWSLYSWAEEGPLGQGENTPVNATNPYPHGPSMTYFPVPFFISSRGYGLHVDTGFRSELHLGSERVDAWRVAVNARAFAMTVYVGDPLAVLDAWTKETGRPVIPAPWVWGPRRRISPGQNVDGGAEWALMRERHMPITGIDDAVHFLPASSQIGREDELRGWTSTLHANGFKVMAYNNPFVAQNNANAATDYAYGTEHGYFVTEPDGGNSLGFLISGTPLYVAMIDFTNDEASAWYRTLLQRTVDLGYDGWMHDFGEYVTRTARFSDGRRGDEMHNLYPMLSAKEARTVLQAALPDDHLFFVRAGYTGSQAFVPAVWGGDAETSFDETQGIPSTIRSGLNLALTGVPYWGSDGTGFKCIGDGLRDKEVYLRWLELEAVSPIMMDQNACSNPIDRRTKWMLWEDEQTQDVYRQMASLHTRLQPYFVTLSHQANATGIPVMRPPFLFWPKEPRTWTLDDTFFLGPSLYAAPVLRRGVTARAVWFPPGARYVSLLDDAVYAPGQDANVNARVDQLPLFLVENQLVPLLAEDVQTLAPATVPGVITAASRADVLEVWVALGPSGNATFSLADGTTLTASRGSAVQGRDGFTQSTAACEKCFSEEGATKLRITSSTNVAFDDLTLKSEGPTTRRITWRVWKLD